MVCNCWKYCWTFSVRDVEFYLSVTRCHLRSSTSCWWEQQSSSGATWVSIEDDHTKGKPFPPPYNEMNSFLSASRIRVELIRRIGRRVFVCTVQRCLVSVGCRSRHLFWYPRLTPDHRRHCRMLVRRQQNWNQQHWSHVPFANESIVSLYNCNGRARVFSNVVERLVDCCIKETDEICAHDTQRGRGWHWTHHRISHETSADGSNLWACLPKCGGGSDDRESVWGIGLDVWAISSCYWTSYDHADKDKTYSSSDQLRPDSGCWEKTLSSHDTEKGMVFVMWSSSIDAQVALGEDCCSHKHGAGLLRWHLVTLQ